jgi:hypothetical protein
MSQPKNSTKAGSHNCDPPSRHIPAATDTRPSVAAHPPQAAETCLSANPPTTWASSSAQIVPANAEFRAKTTGEVEGKRTHPEQKKRQAEERSRGMLPQSQRSPRSTSQSATLDADPPPPPPPPPRVPMPHNWFELAQRNGVGLNRIKQVASHAAIWFD